MEVTLITPLTLSLTFKQLKFYEIPWDFFFQNCDIVQQISCRNNTIQYYMQ